MILQIIRRELELILWIHGSFQELREVVLVVVVVVQEKLLKLDLIHQCIRRITVKLTHLVWVTYNNETLREDYA